MQFRKRSDHGTQSAHSAAQPLAASRSHRRRWLKLGALGVAAAFAISACAKGGAAHTPSDSANNKADSEISVVASTNMWGAVAQAVAGDDAQVTSIITSPEQDPHGFQASAQDKLLVNKAAVVIVNGGSYDDWALKLAQAAPDKPQIIDAVQVSGLEKADAHDDKDHDDKDHDDKDHDEAAHGHPHSHGAFNEHVFYSLETAAKVANQVRDVLAKKAPAKADVFTANAKAFTEKLDQLEDRAEQFAKKHKHLDAVATEPVAGYLMQELGIHDLTPPEFVEQSETDAGPAVAVVNETLQLLKQRKVQVLVLNGQTEDAVSKQLADAAKAANIPVVRVYETLPTDVDGYVAFMDKMVNAFISAIK